MTGRQAAMTSRLTSSELHMPPQASVPSVHGCQYLQSHKWASSVMLTGDVICRYSPDVDQADDTDDTDPTHPGQK